MSLPVFVTYTFYPSNDFNLNVIYFYGLEEGQYLPLSMFLCRYAPKRSARLSASASKPPAAKKQKRGRKSSATVSREEVATPSTANVTLPAIPPDLVEQLVKRVADEVSRRMASGNGGLPSNTNALKEVPVIDMTAAGSAANGISPLVQGSINAVQKNLAGETVPKAVPDQLFISSSLPVDARVTDKIRAKICNQEYIDFGTLLANPVLDI